MRILFVAAPHPESAWLYKALQESAHSLQRADDLRDGAFLATQEPFDAIVLVSLEAASYDGLIAALPEFVEVATGAAIVVVLGRVERPGPYPYAAGRRGRLLRATVFVH